MSLEIVLVSKEGTEHPITLEAAKKSTTLSNVLEDSGCQTGPVKIPLNNITGYAVGKYIEFANYSVLNPSADSVQDVWPEQFFQVSPPLLIELANTANFLSDEKLLTSTCKKIASLIVQKTVSEIREMFQIPDVFTQEEKARFDQEDLFISGAISN